VNESPQAIAEFAIEWPQSPDDFAEGSKDELEVYEHPKRMRPVSTPPPIPRATPRGERARSETQTPCIGDWQIEFVLGRGATGAVYAVVHREFGKRAALKISHKPIDSGDLGAKVFMREARVVQRIDHPSMPDVFATGTHEGRPYLVMERLTGETLAQLLDRGALERGQAFDVLIEVCDVLAVAHQAAVVHRDLKLDNVFVTDRSTARVKLLDWGFARLLIEDDPLKGMIAGALNYVAPEQVLGQPITPATDVYSLGVLTYRLLLGEKPFSGTDDIDLVRRHMYNRPPDPVLLWPEIPRPLAQLIVRMLAKEPDARPTLAEVSATLSDARAKRRRRFSLTHAVETIGLPPSLAPSLKHRAIGVAVAIACMALGAALMFAS
jgi:serine/threonine protein kinase